MNPTELPVPLESGGTVTALVYGAVERRPSAALVLAHGAGAGQQSPFMTGFATALASLGVDAITFNFPYTEQRRRLPDRRPVLDACYRSVVRDRCTPRGRAPRDFSSSVASRWVAAWRPRSPRPTRICPSAGSCCSGIRFIHPAVRPTCAPHTCPGSTARCFSSRAAATPSVRPPSSGPILASLSPTATLHVVAGANHSFKVPRASKQEQAAVFDDVQRTIVEWIQRSLRLPLQERTRLRAERQRPLPPGSRATGPASRLNNPYGSLAGRALNCGKHVQY